jgi:hypothetical protein
VFLHVLVGKTLKNPKKGSKALYIENGENEKHEKKGKKKRQKTSKKCPPAGIGRKKAHQK